MEKKGFMFSQNLMDELGTHYQDSNSYSSGELWTDSQFRDSQDMGYQTSDSLPESFLPSRPRSTISRPPSCPSIAVSQRSSITPYPSYQSNDQRWKFRPAMGASVKKNDANERDLRSHLEKVGKSINMIPSHVSKLLEEAVTYIDSSVNKIGKSGLGTVSAIDEIKHSLEKLKTDLVEAFQLQKEATEKCVKLDDIYQANDSILDYLERQEINIANIKDIILNSEKGMGAIEVNKAIGSLDDLIQGVTGSESNIVQKIGNISSELESSFEVYKVNMKSQFGDLSRKLTDYIVELQETKDLVNQLPSQIKSILREELKNVQNSVAKRPLPLDLNITDSANSPKRRATPSLSNNYPSRGFLPLPTVKINEKSKLAKEEKSTNITTIMTNAFQLKNNEDSKSTKNDSTEPFSNFERFGKKSRHDNIKPAQVMNEDEVIPFTQDLPIFGQVDSEDDSDNGNEDNIDSFIENEFLNNAQLNITTFSLSDSF